MFHFLDFINGFFSLSHGNWEFSQLHEDISEKLGGLFGNRVRGNENIVFFGPFLYFSFVFVESFKTINIDVRDFLSGAFFNMDGIGKDTNLKIRDCGTLILL